MKKAFVLISALLFASCSFWNEPVEEFFSYWSAEAYITDSSVSYPNQPDGDGVINVASNKAAIVILKTVNPKSFRFIMPSSGNTGMIHFNGFETQPEPDTDYTLEQISADKLKLTFKQEFLKQYEWGAKDLGASLTLFADDGRKFNKPYTFKIKSNTMPPTPTVILAKTKESTSHYVLCLTVPDMDAQVNGEKLHKDIAQIVINESSYELKINDLGSDFVKPTNGSFIKQAEVAQLTGAEAVPTGNWILYYKTDREVDGAYKTYEIKLKDEKGVCSETLKTGTSLNKLPSENVTIVIGEEDSGTGTEDEPIIIKPANSTSDPEIEISHSTSGAAVYCTVTVIEVESTTPMQYTGNPVTVPLALGGANEKAYEIKYHSECTNYNPSDVQTKYYKILKLHTVTFNANGGKFADDSTAKTATVLHGRTVTAPSTSPTQDGLAFLGWYKEEAGTTAWDFTNDAITKDTTLYAKWSSAALFIKSTDADAWKKLKEEAAKTSGTHSVIVIDGEIKATTDSGNSGEITIGRNLTIQGKTGADTDKLNVNSQNHRIFKVTDGKTLTLKNLTLKGGKVAASGEPGGGAIYAEGTLTMTDCTVTDNETDYGNGGGIYAESDLTMTRCTVSNNTVSDSSGLGGGGIYIHVTGTHTMTNCTVTNNEAKYSHGGGIYAMGTLSMMNCTVTGNKAQSSGTGSGSGGGIYTTGNLTMTGGTVTGNEAQSNGKGGGIYIDGNGSFTMTGVTVSSNTTVYGDGGGIYIAENGSLTMTDGAVSSNTTQYGLGGGIFVSGTSAQFTMKDSAYITPSSAGEENQQGKNDVYLHDDAKIMLSAALTGTAPAARITVPHIKYASTTQVLAGTAALLNSEHTKFTVTPQTLSGGKILYWEADASGKLMRIVDSVKYPDKAWKALKDAVDNATAGETIFIRGTVQATADTSTVTGNSGDITINKNLTIKGESETSIGILDANKNTGGKPKHRIFKVEIGKTLTIQNLTLTGGIAEGTGEAGTGGAIYAKGATVNITNCTLKGNEAKSGGAICAQKHTSSPYTPSNVTIEGGTIGGTEEADANKAAGAYTDGGGGGIYIGEACKLTLKDSAQVIGNTAVYNGAGIYTKGDLTMENCTITDNKTTGADNNTGGGGVYVESGMVEIKDATKIYHNYTSAWGGGIYVNNGTVTLKNATIGGEQFYDGTDPNKSKGNKAESGGGIYVKNGTITMENCTLSSNTAIVGGGIQADNGNLTVNDCTLTNNEAVTYGGGIYVTGGSLTLNNTTIGGEQFYDGTDPNKSKGNKAKSGGGVYIKGNGTLVTMNGGSIQYNKTTDGYGGGGVCIKGEGISFTMNGGKITHCKADVTSSSSTDGHGGGICVDYAPSPINITIKGSAEISHNESTCQGTESGGGIYGGTNSIITVSENATIKNNKAKGFGGGVYLKDTFKFTGGTITENTASLGAGIFSENSSTTLEMSGNARVANDNDIYLNWGSVITITGPLTGTAPVACITVADSQYKPTTQVLTGTAVNTEHTKFSVTRGGTSPKNWYVGNDGKLTDNPAAIFNTISKAQIQAAESSMTKTTITDRQTNLLHKLILYKTSGGNYGIMHVTDVHNTDYSGLGHITFNYETFKSDGTIKQSGNNEIVKGTFFFDLDEASNSDTNKDFWLENTGPTSSTRHFKPENGAKFYVLP